MDLTTTTEFLEATTQVAYSTLLSASDILSDGDTSAAAIAISDHIEHQGSNQITFEIPSNVDLERIKSLDNFTNLLHRIGNSVYTSAVAGAGAGAGTVDAGGAVANSVDHLSSGFVNGGALAIGADGHPITSDQISNSVVLNLADLKNSATSGLERFFNGADMHSIINYLWIGVVTSLIILSVVFIIFSCYFYRKFREWKKCNKDIRSHMNNDLYPGNGNVTYTGPSGELLVGHPTEDGYYQMESPPCYTIATGLPTYDEALSHHRHQDRCYTFGRKFIYPTTLTTVHHHHQQQQQQQQELLSTTSSWEKDDVALTLNTTNNKKASLSSTVGPIPAYSHQWQQRALAAGTIAYSNKQQSCFEVRIEEPTTAVQQQNQMEVSVSSQDTTCGNDSDVCSDVVVIS